MKKIAIIAVMAAMASGAFAQGIVRFQNRVSGVFIYPIYGVNPANPAGRISGNASTNGGVANYTGVPLLSGTGYSAGLFAAPVGLGNSVDTPNYQTAFAEARFQTATTLPGVINGNNAVTVTGPNGTTPWNFVVRAWDNNGGTVLTWAAAMANPALARGESDVFTITPTVTPNPAANMTTFTSFNLQAVPEPSLIALGALGLGALLLRRRKA